MECRRGGTETEMKDLQEGKKKMTRPHPGKRRSWSQRAKGLVGGGKQMGKRRGHEMDVKSVCVCGGGGGGAFRRGWQELMQKVERWNFTHIAFWFLCPGSAHA